MRLFGPSFQGKKGLEERLGAKIMIRGDQVTLTADTAAQLKKACKRFTGTLVPEEASFREASDLPPSWPKGGNGGGMVTAGRLSNVYARTAGQARFLDAVSEHDLTFVIGPAGTGKTYLAVAMAVEALKNKAVERIVLVRPAVEAGESLGFLPGNLREKVDPYLAPLYDALYDILPRETMRAYFEEKVIEVSPLAYMRGRTLNSAFIILDEAQNATLAQMKMFLTRLGRGSRAIVAGDVTQIDLEANRSGLLLITDVLKNVPDIAFVRLDASDVVRHRLVRSIINAYEDFERNNGNAH